MGNKWWIVVGLIVAALFWNSADETEKQENLPVFSPPVQTQTTEKPEDEGTLEFPFVIRGTELIAQCFVQYEGPFLEDEVQEPVTAVAALMVYNPGSHYIKNAQISMQQGGNPLLFEITMLPPGSRVLVLEKNGSPYSSEQVDQCQCLFVDTVLLDAEQGIVITEGTAGLLVDNQTGQPVTNITIYYKQYNDEDGFYLGGYTETKSIGSLAEGEAREVKLYRYVSGYSRVVAVTAEK